MCVCVVVCVCSQSCVCTIFHIFKRRRKGQRRRALSFLLSGLVSFLLSSITKIVVKVYTDRHQCSDMFSISTLILARTSLRSCVCVIHTCSSISFTPTHWHYRGPYLSKIDFIVSTGAKKNTQSVARNNVWRGGPVKMYDTSDW